MTLEELEADLAKTKKENEDLTAAHAVLKTQHESVTKVLGSIKPEDFPAIVERATKVEELEKKNLQLQAERDTMELAKDFPQIADWSVIAGKDKAELRANAEKLIKMLPKPAVSAPGGGRGPEPDPWALIPPPPAGGGRGELGDNDKAKLKARLSDGMKAGNVNDVLDATMALQPNATKLLLQRMLQNSK